MVIESINIESNFFEKVGGSIIIWLQSCNNQQVCEVISWLSVFISELSLGWIYYVIIFIYLFFIKLSIGVQLVLLMAISSYFSLLTKMLLSAPRPYWLNTDIKAIECRDSTFGMPSGHLVAPIVIFLWLIYEKYANSRKNIIILKEMLNKESINNDLNVTPKIMSDKYLEIKDIIHRTVKNNILVTILLVIVALLWLLLVSFSRMYVGVHYLHDILLGSFIAIIIVLIYICVYIPYFKPYLLYKQLGLKKKSTPIEYKYPELYDEKIPEWIKTRRGIKDYIDYQLKQKEKDAEELRMLNQYNESIIKDDIEITPNDSIEQTEYINKFEHKSEQHTWHLFQWLLILFIITIGLSIVSVLSSYYSIYFKDLSQWKHLAEMQCTDIFDPQTNSFINGIQLSAAIFGLAGTLLILVATKNDHFPEESHRRRILRAFLFTIILTVFYGPLLYFSMQWSYKLFREYKTTNFGVVLGISSLMYVITAIGTCLIVLLPIIPLELPHKKKKLRP
jgi:membrane-associated phospholipid phosphatase